MAGYIPITQKYKREDTVRPQIEFIKSYIYPLHDESGEAGAEQVHANKEDESTWEGSRLNVEDFETPSNSRISIMGYPIKHP